MKIVWNEQSVRWFQNASEYTGYNKKLAALLLERIPRRTTLCDLGCGAALIDFELAPHFEQITCVDISGDAIKSVGERALMLGVKNIEALRMDAGKLEGQWDTVIALFHGSEDLMARYLRLAGDRLILATHGSRKGNFGPEGHKVEKCSDVASYKALFDKLGIKYGLDELTLEYGQPLTGIDDAEAFVRAYTTPMSQSEMDAHLERCLEKTGDKKFPYYLPNRKSFGIFVIERDKNANI